MRQKVERWVREIIDQDFIAWSLIDRLRLEAWWFEGWSVEVRRLIVWWKIAIMTLSITNQPTIQPPFSFGQIRISINHRFGGSNHCNDRFWTPAGQVWRSNYTSQNPVGYCWRSTLDPQNDPQNTVGDQKIDGFWTSFTMVLLKNPQKTSLEPNPGQKRGGPPTISKQYLLRIHLTVVLNRMLL